MKKEISRRLSGIAKRVSEIKSGFCERIKYILNSKEMLARVGYYAGLAVLLAMLGVASYAWRVRHQARSAASSEPPRTALSAIAPLQSPAPTATPEPISWVWPLEGGIVGEYSPDEPVWSETLEQWQTHPALDIAGSPGEAVYACRDGSVTDAWSDRLWGNVVVIAHDDGYRSTYAGMNTLEMVKVGDGVEAGQVIGSVGRSVACEEDVGWHLHFELTKDGAPVDFRTLQAQSEAQ